ncbi:hypothetical protein AAE250_18230 [Bacteroides sp. GD17]|jgi:hypothetical protein|uniref:hypothetical protein n=1 Tax=Bacteroides sp. GD17 TaxID=3139826 RepID=UPI0025D932F8|nr:hypothetical protein [uncultured Bacteroides sp.]
MKTFDANIHLADYYFSMLNSLSDKAKLYLVNKLTESLMKSVGKAEEATETKKDEALRKLAGVWTNDPDAEAMEKAIRTGRRSNKTRKITSFDE